MKKRLLSLFLSVLMVVSMLVMASCSEDDSALARLSGTSDEFTTTSSNDPLTISIFSIRGEGTTDEAIELVERELSRIAVNRYNTKIDLVLIDEEEYAAIMFYKIKMAIAQYNTSLIKDLATIPEEELAIIRQSNVDYQYNDNGIKRPYNIIEATSMPSDVAKASLDIFLCYTPEAGNGALYQGGKAYVDKNGVEYGMFDILYNEKALAPLGSYLKQSYSDVLNVPYTHALEYVTRPKDPAVPTSTKEIFAIPNNYVYGEYEYIIFNEKYVNEFVSPNGNGIDKSDYVNKEAMYDCLVNEVYSKYEAGKPDGEKIHTEITFSSYEEYLEFSIEDKDKNDEYTNDFAIARIIGTKATGELFGDKTKHSELDVYVKSSITVGQEDGDGALIKETALCESMYCIGLSAMGATQDGVRVKRALDILKLMNTNKEFRNILQYGVEGTHYTQYTENEDVNPISSSRPDSKYMNMNPKYFGNMFLLYTSSNMSEEEKLLAKNHWQLAKDQIVDLVPYLSKKKN